MARPPMLRLGSPRWIRVAAALVALLLLGANQSCERPGTVYGLTVDSAFERGCFPPALCPVVLLDLGGTFRLIELEPGPITRAFLVKEIFWLVRLGGEDVRIRGWGSYWIGGEFAVQHRMTLHLRVGDEEPAVFDSGIVPVNASQFPDIDIRVSGNREMVFGTVFDLRAVPFPSRSPQRTPCGPTRSCDQTTEFCVARIPFGPVVYECQPIPVGCEEDRSCRCAGAALWAPPFDCCREPAKNTLECECLRCQ